MLPLLDFKSKFDLRTRLTWWKTGQHKLFCCTLWVNFQHELSRGVTRFGDGRIILQYIVTNIEYFTRIYWLEFQNLLQNRLFYPKYNNEDWTSTRFRVIFSVTFVGRGFTWKSFGTQFDFKSMFHNRFNVIINSTVAYKGYLIKMILVCIENKNFILT